MPLNKSTVEDAALTWFGEVVPVGRLREAIWH